MTENNPIIRMIGMRERSRPRHSSLSGIRTALGDSEELKPSITPIVMSHWQPVKSLLLGLPLRHELIHQRNEADIVSGFDQVNHLVNNDIFKTLPRFLGEIGIQTDCAS